MNYGCLSISKKSWEQKMTKFVPRTQKKKDKKECEATDTSFFLDNEISFVIK